MQVPTISATLQSLSARSRVRIPTRGHDLRAVDQRQAFFGLQGENGNPRLFHGFFSGHPLSLINRLPFSDQDRREMRQGRQIPAGSYRPLFGNQRMDARVDHLHEGLQNLISNPGISLGQNIGPENHDRPGRRLIEKGAYAHGVAADEVPLEIFDLRRIYDLIAEKTEPRGDPVDLFAPPERAFHKVAGFLHLPPHGGVNR